MPYVNVMRTSSPAQPLRAVRVGWGRVLSARLGGPRLPSPLDIVLRASEGGSVTRWQVGPRVVWQVNEPGLVNELLVTRADEFLRTRHLQRALAPIIGEGLLISDGPVHRAARVQIGPVFRPGLVPAQLDRAMPTLDAWLARLDTRAPIELEAALGRLTLALGARMWLPDVDDRTLGVLAELVDALQVHGRRAVRRDRQPPAWLPSRERRALRGLMAERDRLFDSMLDAALSQPVGQRVPLVEALFGDDRPVAEQRAKARDTLFSLLTATQEGTTATCLFSLHLLAHHPSERVHAVAEADALRAPAVGGPPRYRDARAVARILKEAHRLYPPGWITLREPVADTVLGGYPVRRGTLVAVAPWALHRSPRWFPEPERFSPERWTTEFEDDLPRGAYLPFGAGPHHCIGVHVGTALAATILLAVLRRFDLRPIGPETLPLSPAITLRPRGGLPMGLTPRSVAAMV